MATQDKNSAAFNSEFKLNYLYRNLILKFCKIKQLAINTNRLAASFSTRILKLLKHIFLNNRFLP